MVIYLVVQPSQKFIHLINSSKEFEENLQKIRSNFNIEIWHVVLNYKASIHQLISRLKTGVRGGGEESEGGERGGRERGGGKMARGGGECQDGGGESQGGGGESQGGDVFTQNVKTKQINT